MLKNRFFKLFLIASIFSSTLISAQGINKDQALNQVIFTALNQFHISPKNLDDTYSKSVYELYLKRLDFSKRFFLQSDIDFLDRYKYLIDDELKLGTNQFYTTSQSIFKERIAQAKKYAQVSLTQPLLRQGTEWVEFDGKKRKFCRSEKEIQNYWRQIMKEQVINQYLLLVDSELSGNVKEQILDTRTLKIDKRLEKRAVEKVAKNFKQIFDRLEKENEDEKKELYVNSLISVFDSHTSYFPPDQKKEFDIAISGKLEGIGAVLQEENGFIKVTQIVPGSPCWLEGQLKENDLILKVAQGNKDGVDVVGSRVSDVVRLIRGKKGTKVRLTVKKPSGQVLLVPIIRDVVVIEETYAKSAVITDERSKKKMGYIYLPKFYRDFEDARGRNTTDDIKKEISKLLQQDVQGIIIDLRNNSGGALKDAIDMSGLFIEQGPIVQVKGRDERSFVHSDLDLSIYYKGPLLVIVNSYSASASEIFAAAMQDYRRALIVGTSSSFGKGTVQTFIDFDQTFPGIAEVFSPLGSLKVTIQKFYRITGESTQFRGVVPDIILPDSSAYLEVGEKHLDYPLPWDTISAVTFESWNKNRDLSAIRKHSSERVKHSNGFKSLQRYISQIKQERESTNIQIALPQAIARRHDVEVENKSFENQQKPFEYLKIYGTINRDSKSVESQKQQEWLKTLSKDPYLEESVSLIQEL